LGPRGWTSIRAVDENFLPYSTQFPSKNGETSIWTTFLVGLGVDFYSVMEQTRRVDLYWGGGFEHFSAFYFVKESAGLRIEEDASEYKIGM